MLYAHASVSNSIFILFIYFSRRSLDDIFLPLPSPKYIVCLINMTNHFFSFTGAEQAINITAIDALLHGQQFDYT